MQENPLELLVTDLTHRQKYLLDKSGSSPDRRNKAWKIHNKDPKSMIETTYGYILVAIDSRIPLSSLISNIGNSINRKYRLDADPVEQAHIGWFILVSYFELGYLKYVAKHIKKPSGKKSKYPTYQIIVKDVNAINAIMQQVNKEEVDLFPTSVPVGDWQEGHYHPETGYPLIKNAPEETIRALAKKDVPYIKQVLNKLNRTGWRINRKVFEVFLACMESDVTPFKYAKEIDPVKKASLLIEVNAIKGIAERNINNPFYHLYNLDFRGRIYPNTAFLHEQSSDNAKGLLLLDEPVVLGKDGYKWLLIYTANLWGNDKISLDDRAKWVLDNMDDILLYANDPLKYTGWMNADKPFSFLAACFEFDMISNWHGDGYATEDFPSCLPVYIDGSNNGVQHLVAMSQDSEVAPLVNLVPSDLPGDVYLYIAEHVKSSIDEKVSKLTKEEITRFESLFEEHTNLLREIEKWPEKSEKKKLAYAKMLEFKNHNHDLRQKLFPVYWHKIDDMRVWRKTVKRNVMTLAYGGTRQGMGNQVVDDTREINEYLRDKDIKWGFMLGSLVYDICYDKLPGPARMLRMFQELATRENDKERHLAYRSPITDFPFRHNYRRPKNVDINLYYADERLRITLSVWQESTLDKASQKTGTAPNVVHSLDAVHLTTVVHDANYPVTVVHDSFGCHAGNMEDMFKHVREKFVSLYLNNPLEYILNQLNSVDLVPQKGGLDVRQVTSSDYAFH